MLNLGLTIHTRWYLRSAPLIRQFYVCSRMLSNKIKKVDGIEDDWPGKQFTTEWIVKQKGKIADKRPFKFKCEKGKEYKWCACGLSKSQPFCDGSHDGPLMKSVLRPVLFIAPEDKEYWFCNCKQTNRRPFCDGSHKHPDIQAAIRS